MAGDPTASPQVDYATFNLIQMNNEPDWWNDEKFIQWMMMVSQLTLLIYWYILDV